MPGEGTFLSPLKWPLFILIIIIFAVAVYLVIQNRFSEKVMLTFLPALLLASFGVLITILFGLKDEVKEVEFPAKFTYERASLMPFGLARNIGYAPLSEKWASIHLEEIKKAHPQVFKEETNAPGLDLYGDLAVRLVFDSLLQIFSGTWDVKVRKRDFPLVGLDGGGYDEYSPKSDLIPLSKLSDLFPKSYALQTPPILGGAELAIPAGMKLTGRAERNSIGGFAKTFISLENDFVDLELAVTLRGGVGDIGIYSLVTQVPVDEFSKVWTARYLISMKATLKAYRSGHPDMPKYRAWVDNVFETVREHLDSQREWERKDRETHQDLQTQLGAKIDKVDKAILGLQDKNDAILQELARLKGNR